MVFTWFDSFGDFSLRSNMISTLIIFSQALLVNYITASHAVLYKESLLPAVFFVILNSLYPQQLFLSPQILANTFIILLLFRLCYLYESNIPLLLVFDAGIYLGIGLLLSYDLIIYLPFILISVLYMTSFNFRYWLVAIIGIILPIYFLGVIFYLTDHLKDLISSFNYSYNKNYFNALDITLKQSLIWIVIIPVFFLSSFDIQNNFFRNKVKTRRIQLVVFIMSVFGVISVFAENHSFVFGLCFLSVAVSIILANFFISDKKKVLKELIFAFLVICSLYYQYFNP